jgi:hypothetical protein
MLVFFANRRRPRCRVLLEKPPGAHYQNLTDPKVHYCVQKSLKPVPILSHMNPACTTPSYSLLSRICLVIPTGLSPSGFLIKTLGHDPSYCIARNPEPAQLGSHPHNQFPSNLFLKHSHIAQNPRNLSRIFPRPI